MSPSVSALKYKPVPPTRIGVFFLFCISLIFLTTNCNQFPVEKFLRDSKLCTIGEGTSEIQKVVISRNLLK